MGQISSASITCMGVSMLLCILVPIILCVYLKQQGASLRGMVVGAMTFIMFALVAEQVMHTIVLNAFQDFLMAPENVVFYALYGGMAAALFEETGRFLAMKFYMRNRLYRKDALMYGVGHGGIEAIILGGTGCLSNLATAIAINSGTINDILATADDSVKAAVEQMSSVPAWQFLLVGVERMSAITLHICLSFLVYQSVKHHKKVCLLLAYVFHFAVDFFAAFASAKGVSVIVIELLLIVTDVIFVYFVYQMYQKEGEEAEEGVPEKA